MAKKINSIFRYLQETFIEKGDAVRVIEGADSGAVGTVDAISVRKFTIMLHTDQFGVAIWPTRKVSAFKGHVTKVKSNQ